MGLEVTVSTTEDRPGHKHTAIRFTGVLLDESSKKLSHEQLKSVLSRIVSQVQSDFTGHGDQQSWSMTAHIRIVSSAADIKPFTDHVIRLVDSVPGDVFGDGEVGGKQIRVMASLVSKRPTRMAAAIVLRGPLRMKSATL